MSVRLLALTCFGGLLGCQAEPAEDLAVSVAGRRIVLAAEEWRPMVDWAAYARNFEALTNKPPRQYQILTVFLNQMTEDRRSGREIASNEYLEVFLSNPNEVTVLLRRDHGPYWLLSREMFRGVQASGVDLSSARAQSTVDEQKIVEALRNEIDTTRHLLAARLNAQ
jgi:hypothetical protein